MTTDTNPNMTNNLDAEFNDDDFVFESMIDQGYVDEEACRILYNLQHYRSSSSPDEVDSVCTRPSAPIVFSEDDWKIAMEIAEMIAAKSSEQSDI